MTEILKSFLIAVILSFVVSCISDRQIAQPFDLELDEGFSNPIGFYNSNPTFSWKLPAGTVSQSAYSIAVASSPDLLPSYADLWQSGKVNTEKNLYVNYEGKKLESGQRVYWQVKFWDNEGLESTWSEMAFFELGLLENKNWHAKWISLPNQKALEIPKINRKVYPVQYLRKNIEIEEKVVNARLYITAKGLFTAKINGEQVGNDVLTPGWTSYDKRIETLTYDVGGLLRQGKNTIGIELAEGWHSGRLIFRKYADKAPKLLVQLKVKYKNGQSQTFVTDHTWRGTDNGPIRYSSLYDGESYDANYEMPGWSEPDYNDENWLTVEEEIISVHPLLKPKRHNAVTTKISLPTRTITEPIEGSVVFDLGQNMAGVAKIDIPVKKGQEVKIRFGEMLQPNGEIYTENYRSAVSTDFYMPAKDGVIEWHPKFTFHGFRYVELSGFDETATPEKSWVTGLVQYSDFDMSGTFVSSHEKLNKLQSNIKWGLRGNFLDIPTDCPQRDERVGWTGDAQVFIPTSLFIADVHSFWSSWMQSLREDQLDNGAIPVIVPDIRGDRFSSGWGDAATIVPWEVYQRTGDRQILEDSYKTMQGWIKYYESVSENHIPDMFTYGDWLQPYSEHPLDERKGETDEKLINTAYYARSVDITLQTAKVLGLNDQEILKNKLNEIKAVFQNTFFTEEGKVSIGKSTQTAYLLAIAFNLLSPDMEQKAIPHLLVEIKKAENHLRTGFLGTPLLALVLEKIGRTDLIFEMLFKETYPSWFYSINQGATTMWERWDSYTHKDGFNTGGMNSFNHYAYGAIGQFMYERIAGIKPIKPGYKKILIAPLVGGPLTSAKASYESPYGKVSSAWTIEMDNFKLKASVPPNTTAKMVIPGKEGRLMINGDQVAKNKNIKLLNVTEKGYEIEAQPGEYLIESKLY